MAAKPLTTVSTAQTVLPEWYTNVAQDLLSSQNALLNRPYTPYEGSRLAELTPDQLSGLEQARRAATEYQPTLDAAIAGARFNPQAYTGALESMRGALDAASGIGSSIGPAGSIRGAAGPGGLDAASPYFDRAGGMSAFGAANPTLQGALSYATSATSPMGIAMAQPYLDRANDNVANVDEYMNPYDDAVVRRIGDIGARTLREQLAPAINDKFIQSGQLRSSGQSIDEARALRDVAADVTAQQAQLLQQGYTQAQAAKAGDLSRFGGLAQTAGGLGTAQQGALSTAAGQIAGIGSTQGQLTDADRNAIVQMGTTSGQLGGADASRRLEAATAEANARLAAATAEANARLGATTQQGALAQAMETQRLGTATQQGALALQQQNQGLAGANALTAAGGLEQAQAQKGLDIQYENFLRQQGYPQAQIDAMLKTFQGVQPGVPQGSTGFEQQTKTGSSPSLASTILGAASAAKGLGVI